MIEHVLRLRPDLDSVMTERNRPEQRRVHIPVAGGTELVATGVAPRVAGLRKHRRIVPPLIRPWFAEPGLRITNQVDRLLSGLLLQQPVIAGNQKRPSGKPRGDSVYLPALDNPGGQ